MKERLSKPIIFLNEEECFSLEEDAGIHIMCSWKSWNRGIPKWGGTFLGNNNLWNRVNLDNCGERTLPIEVMRTVVLAAAVYYGLVKKDGGGRECVLLKDIV
jgi:hypothetical protein